MVLVHKSRVMSKITKIKEEENKEVLIEDVLKFVTSYLNQQTEPSVLFQLDVIIAIYEFERFLKYEMDYVEGKDDEKYSEIFNTLMETIKFDKIRFFDLSSNERAQYIKSVLKPLTMIN